jgi:uncharacterized glyoxalase superfamily protein PhnB
VQTASPYLFYEDVAAAMRWLAGAFGFRETIRYVDGHGVVTYGELAWGPDRLLITRFTDGYRNPKHTEYISGIVYITVLDVEAHCRQATLAGATIISELEDKPYGLRQYTAEDPEGQRWLFAQQVRDLLPEEWGGVSVDGGLTRVRPIARSGRRGPLRSVPPSS